MWLLAVLALLSGGGCAAIAGLHNVPEDGSDASIAPDASDVVSDAAMGQDASDVLSQERGDDGGGMESGGETGPVMCGNGVASGPALDQLVESCVLTIGCAAASGLYFDDVLMTFCLTYDYLHSREAYSGCYPGIHTCTDFFNCSHFRGATVADCPNAGVSASCNGNLAISCSGQANGYVQDCSPNALGGTCTVSGTYAGCAITPTCTGDAGQCLGNSGYSCYNGIGFGKNCGSGFTCGASGFCFFNAPACAAPNTVQCMSAGVLDICSTAKQHFQDNCATAGSTCEISAGGVGYCISPGCVIASEDNCKESCSPDGKTLNTCIGGAPFQIDCSKYGTFTRCAQSIDTNVTPNKQITYCE